MGVSSPIMGATSPPCCRRPCRSSIIPSRDAIRIETDRGTVLARAVVVTVSTDVLAAEAIRFRPALPGKVEAAGLLPLGLADKLYLAIDRPELFPVEGYCLGSAATGRTAAYHMRPFGRPVIECFYGGELARDLEREGRGCGFGLCHGRTRGPARRRGRVRDPSAPYDGLGDRTGISADPIPTRSPVRAAMRARLAEPVDGRLFFAGEACLARALHDGPRRL